MLPSGPLAESWISTRRVRPQRLADPADRGLLAWDPDDRVRLHLASGPRRPRRAHPKPLSDAALEMLLLHDGVAGNTLVNADEFCSELFFSQQIPQSFLRGPLRHENPALRVHSARMWYSLAFDERQALLDDPDPGVQEGVRQATFWDTEVTAADIPEQNCHARTDRLTNYPPASGYCFGRAGNLDELR